MLNRWHKLIAVAAFAMALPVVANAQTSRVEGLSVQGDYIKDYTAIYTYPSQISHVGNLVYGEFGSGGTFAASDRAVGAVLGNLWEGRYGTWGIHLRSTTPSLGQGDHQSNAGVGDYGTDENTNNFHAFDLMWGKRFGGTSLGFRLNRSVGSAEINTPTTMTNVTLPDSANFGRNIFGFSGGIGFEVNPSTTFEGSFLYQSRTFERTDNPIGGNTNVAEDSPTSYLLAARLMWQWQPNVLVVPVLKYYSYDYSAKRTVGAVTQTTAATQKGWQLGAAGNWTLNQNDLFVLGATFAKNSVEQDGDLFQTTGSLVFPVADAKKIEESIYPQVFAALETHVNPWLTLRFGASQDAYAKIKADPRLGTDAAVQQTFSRFTMNLGAGVKVGGLQFDATMDSDMFNNFTRLSADNAPAFPRVTATYSF
jgi:hypothetical protein